MFFRAEGSNCSGASIQTDNSANATLTVTNDATPPTANCKAPLALPLTNAAGTATITVAMINNGSVDNAGCTPQASLAITVAPTGVTCANIGTPVNAVLSVTDLGGNTATCTTAVTVTDARDPNAVCFPTRTFALTGLGNNTVTPSLLNNGSDDNCTPDASLILTTSPQVSCTNIGTPVTVTLTVTDAAGRTDNCTSLVTVTDGIDPNAVCHTTRTFALTTTGNNTIPGSNLNNGSTDNCGPLTYTSSPTVSCANIGTPVTITMIATDGAGRTDNCTSLVTVTDGMNPTALCKANTTFTLTTTGNNTIPGTTLNNGSSDNCTPTGSLVLTTSPTVSCSDIGTPRTITLTVTDLAGRTATCTSQVTVSDGVNPVAACHPTRTFALTSAGNNSIPGSLLNNGSTDNCAGALVFTTSPPVNCANVGSSVTITLDAEDAAGNSGTCTSLVTITDGVAPTAVCTTATVNLDTGGNATLAASAVNNGSTDNCTGAVTLAVSPNTFTCATPGSQPVVLTVTDVAGNSSTCSTTVNVLENVPPVAICTTATVNFNFDAAGVATIVASSLNNGSGDNCTAGGSLTFTATPATLPCSTHNAAQSIILTVRDQSSNTDTCLAIVAALDVTPPAAVCQDSLILSLDTSGIGTLSITEVDLGSTDNCGIQSSSINTTTFTCNDLGPNVVILNVLDVHNLASACSTVVTVVDTTRPAAACRTYNATLNGSGTAAIVPNDVENGSDDECTLASNLDRVLDRTTVNCTDAPFTFIAMTVEDESGNQDICMARINVIDANPPIAGCQPTTLTLDGAGNATLVPDSLNNNTTDNCVGSLVYGASQTAFTCIHLGTRSIVMTVTDPGGNVRTCTTTVTITDLIDPVADCQDIVVLLDATGNVVVPSASVNGGSTDNCSALAYELNDSTFSCANLGNNNNVILSVTDASGNEDTCHARINVTEASLPVANCSDTIIRALSPTTGTYSLTPATVNNGSVDNCGGLTFSVTPNTFDCTDIGPNTVTLVATDGSSNNSTCTSVFILADSAGPIALCRNISVSLNLSGQASITLSQINNGTYDNCQLDSISIDRNQFECLDVGVQQITLTAIDTAGNQSSCIGNVTIIDPLPPVALCKNDTLYLGANGLAVLSPTLVDSGSYDNCVSVVPVLSKTNFNCSNIGLNNVSLTVTDQGGNSDVCVAQVRVLDTMPPVPLCKTSINVNLNNAGAAVVTVALINNGSMDNCGITGYSVSPPVVNCSSIVPGGVPVQLKPHDAAGNVDSCTTIVNVFDVTPPIAICQDVYVVLDNNGLFELDPLDASAGSFDACGIDTVTVSQSQFNCIHIDTNLVTVTVTDNHGNSSSCISNVILPSVAGIASAQTFIVACSYNVGCAGGGNGKAKVTMADGCAPFTYLWSNGQTADSIGLLSAGTYYVTVTDVLGRTAVDSVTLIAPSPITATALPSAFACEGAATGSILLSAMGGNDCADYTYLWSDGSTLEDRTGLLAGSYSVTITDTVGCTGTLTSIIPLSPSPNPNLDSIVEKCPGSPIVLTAASGFLSYNWSNGATNSSTSVTPSGTYSVTVTNTLGCVGIDTILVNDSPPPSNFITAQGSTTLCFGDTLTLDGGAGFASYAWNTGATSQTITVTGSSDTLSLSVTDAGGCIGRDTIMVTFLQDTLDAPSITPGGPIEICQGETVNLIATAGYASYVWSSGSQVRTEVASAAGFYTVTVTGTTGCTKVSDPVEVIVNPLPVPTITPSGTTLIGSSGFTTYQWYFNAAQIPSATNQTYSPTAPGPHSLEVTDANGCIGTSAIVIVPDSGVSIKDQLLTTFGMRVYPNPTDGRLVLEATKAIPGQLQLEVTDLYGRRLITRQLIGLSNSTEIDLSEVAAGMYLVEVRHAKLGKALFKVVVE